MFGCRGLATDPATNLMVPSADVVTVPSNADQIPAGSFLFSWRSVRTKGDGVPRYFQEPRWKGLLLVAIVAGLFVVGLLLALRR